MTDALRPTRSAGLPLLRRAAPADGAKAEADARSASRMRRPHHVGVMLGLSAGAYAVTLAGVAGLQSATDRAAIEAREPTRLAAEVLAAEHDRLEAELESARRAMARNGDDYDGAVALMADLQTRIDALAATVGELEGQTLALPTRLSLPSAPRVPAAASRPATQASTGASGG